MSKGSNTTTTNQNQMSSVAPSPQAMAAYSALMSRATDVSNTPFTPYTGQEVAPTNAQQLMGVNNNQLAAMGFAPYAGNAGYNIDAAGRPVSASDISQYMDPYTTGVIQATQADFDTQNKRAQSATTGNAAAQGALGGNRVGVTQALTQEGQERVQAPVLAQLRSQGFQSAEQMANQQKARQLQSGQIMDQAQLANAQQQFAFGTQMQQTSQAQDTQQMTDYYTQQGYPFATAQWLAAITLGTGSQMGQTSTGVGQSVKQGPEPNQWAQAAGLGISALAAFSDKRLKENIKEIGRLHDGQKNYRYNFKGNPQTHVGMISQEVEKSHPEAVGKVAGFGTIDYDAATEDAVKRWSGGAIKGFAEGGTPYGDDLMSMMPSDLGPQNLPPLHPGSKYGAGESSIYFPGDSSDQFGQRWMGDNGRLVIRRPGTRASGGAIRGFAAGGTPYGPGTQGWVPTIGNIGGKTLTDPGMKMDTSSIDKQQQPNTNKMGADLGKFGKGLYDNWGSSSSGWDWGADPTGGLGGMGVGDTGGYAGGGRIGMEDGGDPVAAGFSGSLLPYMPKETDQPSFSDRISGISDEPGMPRVPITLPKSSGFGEPVRPSLTGVEPSKVDEMADIGKKVRERAPPQQLTGEDKISPAAATDMTRPTSGYADQMSKIAAAHREIESGNNYHSVGVPSPKDGDRPYGAYQVMGKNVGPWTQQYLGRAMTPQEFLKDPVAQDTVYKARMGQYINQYGLTGALDHWLGMGKSDYLGTTHPEYQRRFMAALQGGTEGVAPEGGGVDISARDRSIRVPGVAGPEGAPTRPGMGGFNPMGLSDEARQGLISMGLGMMANRVGGKGSFLSSVGQGGEQGMTTYASARAQTLEQEMLRNKVAFEQLKNNQLQAYREGMLARENLKPTGALTEDGHPIMFDSRKPGMAFDGITGARLSPDQKIITKGSSPDVFAPLPDEKLPTAPAQSAPAIKPTPVAQPIQYNPEENVDPSKPLTSDQVEKSQKYYTDDLTQKLKAVEETHEPGTHPEVLDRVKARLGPGIAATIKAVSEGRQTLQSVPSRTYDVNGQKVSERVIVEQGVNQYNPGFEQSKAKARADTISDLSPKGKTGQLVLGVNQLIPHIGTAVKAAVALDNSAYPAANTVRNWWLTATGDPRVKKFEAVRDVAALDAARILRGSGAMSIEEVKGWQDRINKVGSPRQLVGVLNMLAGDLMGARMNSIQYSYRMMAGKEAPELLSPHAKDALKFVEDTDTKLNAPNTETTGSEKPKTQERIGKDGKTYTYTLGPDGKYH